jgi:cytochrome c oxidase assembly protein Cox11
VALGASYAAVPLYRMFCAATGFAGTPNVGTGRFEPDRLVPVENAPRIKVHFNADKSERLPWTFTPQQKFVTVLPGETSLAFYTAKNTSPKDIIGIATYNVTPDRVSSDILFKIDGSQFALRLRHIFRRSSVSASKNSAFLQEKKSTCLCFFS